MADQPINYPFQQPGEIITPLYHRPAAKQPKPTKPRVIRNRPRISSVCESPKNEMLRARHPWVENVMICVGIKKLTPNDRNKYRDGLALLLSQDQRPRDRKDCPISIPDDVREAYFRPLDISTAELQQRTLTPSEVVKTIATREGAGHSLTGSFQGDHFFRLLKEEKRKNERLEEEGKQLQAKLDNLMDTMGRQSEEEKSRSLQAYFDHFEKNVRVKGKNKEKTKRDILHRVAAVLGVIGMDRRLGTVNSTTLQDAIDESCKGTDDKKELTETEAANRGGDIKRFFKWLARKVEAGGMALKYDPSAGLEVLSRRALQTRRRLRGEVRGYTDKELATLKKKLPSYWREMLETLCCSGMRASELAALKWSDVDFKNRILNCRANEAYGERKNDISERPIKPFSDVWPILKGMERNGDYVFGRPMGAKKGQPWIEKGENKNMGWRLRQIMERCGFMTEEPCRRARRYWETRMRSIGRGDLIPIMGGHTTSVGLSNYTVFKDLVDRIPIEAF